MLLVGWWHCFGMWTSGLSEEGGLAYVWCTVAQVVLTFLFLRAKMGTGTVKMTTTTSTSSNSDDNVDDARMASTSLYSCLKTKLTAPLLSMTTDETFTQLVVPFLERDSMSAIMKVPEIVERFQLQDFYCVAHGTKLLNPDDDTDERRGLDYSRMLPLAQASQKCYYLDDTLIRYVMRDRIQADQPARREEPHPGRTFHGLSEEAYWGTYYKQFKQEAIDNYRNDYHKNRNFEPNPRCEDCFRSELLRCKKCNVFATSDDVIIWCSRCGERHCVSCPISDRACVHRDYCLACWGKFCTKCEPEFPTCADCKEGICSQCRELGVFDELGRFCAFVPCRTENCNNFLCPACVEHPYSDDLIEDLCHVCRNAENHVG